ncbi:MAG: hypothetical protein JXB88_00700 [Spirochaetales bacterium]|nr:hypothetical protein [Spirochaetales bacterium]
MQRNEVYFYEYPGKNIIIRTIKKKADDYIQVLYNGMETACYKTSGRGRVSFSKNGIIYFKDPDYKKHKTIDINKPFPQEPESASSGEIIHPDGSCVISYVSDFTEQPDFERFSGLLMTDMRSDQKKVLWKKDIPKQINKPFLFLADDGETWLLANTGIFSNIIIGKGGQYSGTADIIFEDEPPSVTFDTENERIFVVDSKAVFIVSPKGEVLHQIKNKIPCEPYEEFGKLKSEKQIIFESPFILWKGSYTVCAKDAYKDDNYLLVLYDKNTFEFKETIYTEIKSNRLSYDKTGLHTLDDNSLAVIPQKEKIVIFPSDKSNRKSNDYMTVTGDESVIQATSPKRKSYNVFLGTYSETETPHKMFPDFEDVFTENLNNYRDKLLPYCSIDLKDLKLDDKKVFLLYTETLDPDSYNYTINSLNKIDSIELYGDDILTPFEELSADQIKKNMWISFKEVTITIREPDPEQEIDWEWQRLFEEELKKNGFTNEMIRVGGYPVFLQDGGFTINTGFICQADCFGNGAYFYLYRDSENKFSIEMQMT